MMMRRIVQSVFGLLIAAWSMGGWGDGLRVAFIAAEDSEAAMGPHNRAAWEAVKGLGDSALFVTDAQGAFVDASGAGRRWDDYPVVWYHQGDNVAVNVLYSGTPLASLREYAAKGGGLLLSGGALELVLYLGLEKEIRPQRRQLEQYRDPASMVIVERAHPVFAGLVEEEGQVWLSRGGCPAEADFYWGGPGEGMVLANTPRGVERPLVEYALGNGRVMVFGWRWPDYADVESPYRGNLLQLTSNMLAYLASPGGWRPIEIRTKFPALAHPDEPGVVDSRWRALRMAIDDLAAAFPDQYPRADEFRAALESLKAEHDQLTREAEEGAYAAITTRFEALQREALLANPLLDFDRLLMIRRSADHLGLPFNYQGNDDIPPTGYSNTLIALTPARPEGAVETVFTPPGDRFMGDLDLHYDADRLLFSMPDEQGRWGVSELSLSGGTARALPLIDDPDVHNYDACYLPDDRIIFTSTAPFIGVPCVGGRSKVANLYLCDPEQGIRRLTNDQDHNWCPAVLNNGRILYQRWEYADIAHAFTRLLFHANPDGSGQMEYYGSNSFWPTALFFARPIPGHPTKVAAVVGGHHDAPRQGELVILDPALGRHETSGVVQRIPGYGEKVEPVILDGLIQTSWPRFLHPYPLSEKYFIVSCKPSKNAHWGVYLVDVFDNFVLLHEEPGWAMLEPTPWRKTARQPVIPDVADPKQHEATVLMTDVYQGPGLAGVPRGTVKSLRLVSYDFTYHGIGGEPDRTGLDGPWDVKRIIGTVPVEPDGSASFRVPACTPVSVQPLDAEGKALALMRSWLTAVPGEVLSCVGCHEPQNTTPLTGPKPLAFRREPSAITPWYGPARGFSFEREVQPVLDAYCVRCHDGRVETMPNFTVRSVERMASAFEMHFTPSYMALRSWVHTPTLESDAHMLSPRDFHADTSRLIQLLRDGHHGVRLSGEAWDRLITWIDLNAPFHGSWREVGAYSSEKQAAAVRGAERRRQLHARYAGIDEDPEAIGPAAVLETPADVPVFDGMTAFDDAPGNAPATGNAIPVTTMDLGEGMELELVRIEPGTFRMGTDRGYPNEQPAHDETIAQAFYVGRYEVTNAQYRRFDPAHDSGLETGEAYQFGDDERGFTLNRPEQPVVRVSCEEATAFCEWLSATTGKAFRLPTEAEWEYACRAGGASALWYGTLDDDFSGCANLSDATHRTVYYPHVPTALPPWRPADTRFDDHWRVSAPVGQFAANPWGLCDMHGNVAEWTCSRYGLYGASGAEEGANTRRVVRGGSWLDCPNRARSAFRVGYEGSQKVHDVGFRVVMESEE